MKIRLLVAMGGTDEKTGEPFSYAKGDTPDLESGWAKRLLESGQAEAVAQAPSKRADKRVTAPGETRG